MKKQIPLDETDLATLQITKDGTRQVLPEIAYKRLGIVNVVFYGLEKAGDRNWVLIDAGLPGTAPIMRHAAEQRFGIGARPAAIVLTHAHFDHVGALESLSEEWDAPIYAHELELPHLDGRKTYPPPDPFVGHGLMPLLSPLFPRGPLDVGPRLHAVPQDGNLPFMPGWSWIATPGHSEGHISLWRESDRTLISGDAIITTNQESAYAVAIQEPELHGPPLYFTPDWVSAEASVRALAQLAPRLVVSGHGAPVEGARVQQGLVHLAENFKSIAIPKNGKYTPASLP